MFIADAADALDRLAAAGAGRAIPPGVALPDPALLTRLANEFLAALPGEAPGAAVPESQPPVREAHAQDLVPDIPLGVPASAGTVPAPESISTRAPPGLAAILASLAADVSAAPAGGSGFYFLDGLAPSSSGIGVPGAAAPGIHSGFASAHPPFDVQAIRRDFPILSEHVHGRPLVWFDNAATTQKPRAVIDRLARFYEHENSNIHRAAHELAARSTDAYEGARATVARFLGAASPEEIVFVRGATEAINLVAAAWGRQNIGAGDEILLTHLEHHANIVPWQQLALEKGARLRVAPVDDRGQVLLEEYGRLLGPKTRLAAFTQVSNALGTVAPVKQMIEMAHRAGARVLVDGAQAVSHMAVDVQALDADFYVFSGHKLFAPTGIGVLYGKKALLDSMPPYQTGGNMIRDVTFERSEFHSAPQRFEAGTGNIADAVGLGAAIDYVQNIGLDNIGRYEHGLLVYATKLLSEIPGLCIVGTAAEKAGVISLVLDGVPTEDVGTRLDREGIAVRSGHHCAQPILRRFGHESTVRPSFAFYNTCAEIDLLAAALRRIAADHGLARL